MLSQANCASSDERLVNSLIRISITAVAKNQKPPTASLVICDDQERNVFALPLKVIKQNVSFTNGIAHVDSPEDLLRALEKNTMLYSLNGQLIPIWIAKEGGRGMRLNTFDSFFIRIEDGINSNIFKIAYPSPGEYFEFLPLL